MIKYSFISFICSIEWANSSPPSEAYYSHHQHIIHKRFPLSFAIVIKHRFVLYKKDHKLIRLHNFICICFSFVAVEAEAEANVDIDLCLKFTGQYCDTT